MLFLMSKKTIFYHEYGIILLFIIATPRCVHNSLRAYMGRVRKPVSGQPKSQIIFLTDFPPLFEKISLSRPPHTSKTRSVATVTEKLLQWGHAESPACREWTSIPSSWTPQVLHRSSSRLYRIAVLVARKGISLIWATDFFGFRSRSFVPRVGFSKQELRSTRVLLRTSSHKLKLFNKDFSVLVA